MENSTVSHGFSMSFSRDLPPRISARVLQCLDISSALELMRQSLQALAMQGREQLVIGSPKAGIS